jgi:hypothetical protein
VGIIFAQNNLLISANHSLQLLHSPAESQYLLPILNLIQTFDSGSKGARGGGEAVAHQPLEHRRLESVAVPPFEVDPMVKTAHSQRKRLRGHMKWTSQRLFDDNLSMSSADHSEDNEWANTYDGSVSVSTNSDESTTGEETDAQSSS